MLISYIKSVIIWSLVLVATMVIFEDGLLHNWGKYCKKPYVKITVKNLPYASCIAIAAIPIIRGIVWLMYLMLGICNEEQIRNLAGDEFTDSFTTSLKEKLNRED